MGPFADDSLKYIFVIENYGFPINISIIVYLKTQLLISQYRLR